MSAITAGPGDAITWPPCDGHPLDPRTDDDGRLTLEQARSEAEDQAECTPELLVAMLQMEIDAGESLPPVDLHAWRREHDGDVAALGLRGLLAVLIGGQEREALDARFELRDRLLADADQWIDGRAKLLMTEVA